MSDAENEIAVGPLVSDGERFLPEHRGTIRYEHLHRYALCLPYVQGRRVLDAASGEGYGSALLAASAGVVVGVDKSPAAVAHARGAYSASNLRFELGDVTALPLADGSVDVAVSFETIEHLRDHERMLEEFKRVLTSNGLLIISSPNKAIYSDSANYTNPYHEHELYIGDFVQLLRRHFKNIDLFGQRVIATSTVVRLDVAPSGVLSGLHGSVHRLASGVNPPLPMYAIALCSDDAIETAAVESLYVDDEQDLFGEMQARSDKAYEMFVRAKESYEIARVSIAVDDISLRTYRTDGIAIGHVDIIEEAYTGNLLFGAAAVGRRASIFVTGWVLLDNEPADRVAIVLGETVVSLAVPAARPDVGAVYGANFGFCGFRAIVPLGHPSGQYTFDVVALSERDRRKGRLSSFQIRVVDEQGGQLSDTLHLDPIEFAGVQCESDRTFAASNVLRIRGWAFHPQLRLPFETVALLIDEHRIVPLIYGSDRRDVWDHFGLEGLRVGIEQDIIAQTLGVGPHELRLCGSNVTDGVHTYVSSNTVRLQVEA